VAKPPKAPVAKPPKPPKPTAAETKAKNDAIKAGQQSARDATKAANKVKADAQKAKQAETLAANKAKQTAIQTANKARQAEIHAANTAAKAKKQADWDTAHPVEAANKLAKAELTKRAKAAADKLKYDKSARGKLDVIEAGEKAAADKLTADKAAADKDVADKAVEKTRQDDITTQAQEDASTPASSDPYAMGGGGGGIMGGGLAGSGAQIQTRPTFAMPRGIDAAYVNDIRSKLMPVRDSALSPANTMKNGGRVAPKAFAKGGIVRSAKPAAKTTSKPAAKTASRGDGCAQRGRTKGKYC
jgi:membrane protein involved in colicin uptake